jgi:hypothetical protein
VHGRADRGVVPWIPEHLSPVDNDCESFADAMPDAEPYPARRIEAHDLNPDAKSEVPQELFRHTVRPLRVFADECGRFSSFFFLQLINAIIGEGLRTRRSAGFQDCRKKAEQLDPRRAGRHRFSTVEPT